MRLICEITSSGQILYKLVNKKKILGKFWNSGCYYNSRTFLTHCGIKLIIGHNEVIVIYLNIIVNGTRQRCFFPFVFSWWYSLLRYPWTIELMNIAREIRTIQYPYYNLKLSCWFVSTELRVTNYPVCYFDLIIYAS